MEFPEFLNLFNKVCKNYLPNINNINDITAEEYLSHEMEINYDKFNCEILSRSMDPEYKYLSKKITKKYNQSNDAFIDGKFDKALNLSNELLANSNIEDFDKAMILRIIGYIYLNQGNQSKADEYLTKSLCLNSLNINDQFSTHKDIVNFYHSNNQDKNVLTELLKMHAYFTKIYNTEKKPPGFLGAIPLPKNNWLIEIEAMLSEIYLNHAKYSPKKSKAEKEFYKKGGQYIKNALSNSFSPPNLWYLIYLDILIYEENYDEAFKILEKIVNYSYFYQEDYKKYLSDNYLQLKLEDEIRFQKILDDVNLNPFINLTLESKNISIKYPGYARQQSIDGWSLIEYDINHEGKVINPVAIDFSNDIFNKNSIKSISKTIFNVKNIKTEDLPLKNQRTIFYFYIKECPWPSVKKPTYEVAVWKSCIHKPKFTER